MSRGWYASSMKRTKLRKVTAWLITRHWTADYPKREVVAILSPRIGGVRVRDLVDFLNMTKELTLGEQISVMWPRHGRTPHPARFGQTKEGEPWAGEILCGNDPFLRARIVDDLTVERDSEGGEIVNWKERSRPSSLRKGNAKSAE
jgi:hypothetical protein